MSITPRVLAPAGAVRHLKGFKSEKTQTLYQFVNDRIEKNAFYYCIINLHVYFMRKKIQTLSANLLLTIGLQTF